MSRFRIFNVTRGRLHGDNYKFSRIILGTSAFFLIAFMQFTTLLVKYHALREEAPSYFVPYAIGSLFLTIAVFGFYIIFFNRYYVADLLGKRISFFEGTLVHKTMLEDGKLLRIKVRNPNEEVFLSIYGPLRYWYFYLKRGSHIRLCYLTKSKIVFTHDNYKESEGFSVRTAKDFANLNNIWRALPEKKQLSFFDSALYVVERRKKIANNLTVFLSAFFAFIVVSLYSTSFWRYIASIVIFLVSIILSEKARQSYTWALLSTIQETSVDEIFAAPLLSLYNDLSTPQKDRQIKYLVGQTGNDVEIFSYINKDEVLFSNIESQLWKEQKVNLTYIKEFLGDDIESNGDGIGYFIVGIERA